MEDLQREVSKQGLSISNLADKGRCLFSARDFSPGDIIVSEEPYVSVPNKTSANSRCECCFTTSNLKRCSACQIVYYCGSTCQKSDWKLHCVECRAISKLDKDRLQSLTPSIRLMLKLFLRRNLQNEKIISTTATDNYTMVEALVSHMSEIDEKQLVLYAQMANLVSLLLGCPDDISVKEIAENFSKLACNAHTICDSELSPLGTGLYPVISIINHSCLPNSVLVFEGRRTVVRAVQYIPKGTEISISYIETAGSTATRQKALKEQYYFCCTCTRCNKEGQYEEIEESAILEGYRCKDSECNGYLLRETNNKGFACQKCGCTRDKEEIKKVASEISFISDKASVLLSSRHSAKAGEMYKKVEKLQLKLCHPFSINLMRTREALLKIFLELQCWEDALIYCRWTIPVYQRVYLGLHPLLGLQYYTCGKIEWFLGKTEEAVESLGKAVEILKITHGTTTRFVKELILKLDEARAEASYKLSSYAD